MIGTITTAELRAFWREGREVALFDVREEGSFSLSHPFFAVPLPISRLEISVGALVPRKTVPVAVYDDGEGLAAVAAARLAKRGYTDIRLLEGGLAAYAREGEVFRDVNVPSKAFGELVEAIRGTPSLPAREVRRLIDEHADMVVLDVRRFEEYQSMSLPSAISVPNGELALRVRALAPSPQTLVVVNCAGRTRSIIGTQTLVNAGIPNPVAALRNGTIGWTLEGYSLEHGQKRRYAESTEGRTEAREAALAWAEKTGVRTLDAAGLSAIETNRTVYRFDVRTPEEYRAGHPQGFVSAPGGQLVQATDEWAAVRGAVMVLFDDDGVRARMTGSWLAQMGWEVAVIADLPLVTDAGRATAPGTITPDELARTPDAVIVDVGPSPVYAKGHIPDAWFLVRSRFREDVGQLPPDGEIVVTSGDGWLAHYAAEDLEEATGRLVRVLSGGTEAWVRKGHSVERANQRWASPAIDVYKRPYEGTDNSAEAMRAYIEWELHLVAQMANDGIANFRVVR